MVCHCFPISAKSSPHHRHLCVVQKMKLCVSVPYIFLGATHVTKIRHFFHAPLLKSYLFPTVRCAGAVVVVVCCYYYKITLKTDFKKNLAIKAFYRLYN